MARSRLSIHEFPGSCLFEALGSSTSSLHLWHDFLSLYSAEKPQVAQKPYSSRTSSQTLTINPIRVLGQSFLGASIVCINGPCLTGTFSETAISDISSTIRFSKAYPNSGWAFSRPRNLTVTFTLFPSPMNCLIRLFFTSRSCTSVLGRILISLT